MLLWMKNLGYPVSMLSTTHLSPVAQPTLDSHVGRETLTAWRGRSGQKMQPDRFDRRNGN